MKTALRRARYNADCRAEAERQDFERTLGFTAEKSKDVLDADFCEWAKTYDGPRFKFLSYLVLIYNDNSASGYRPVMAYRRELVCNLVCKVPAFQGQLPNRGGADQITLR